MLSVLVSSLVPLCVLTNKSGLSAGPLSFWGIEFFQVFLLILMRLRSVPLMGGGLQSPSVSRSPEVAQKRAGAAHGPLHPALLTSKFLGFVFWFGCSKERFLLGFCPGFLLWGQVFASLSPSSFGPWFVFLSWFFWVPRWVGGASSQ